MERAVALVAPEVLEAADFSPNVNMLNWSYGFALTTMYRTLQRLGHMRELVETKPFRPRQRLVILTKLGQHEAKLSDLASKYSVRRLVSLCMRRG